MRTYKFRIIIERDAIKLHIEACESLGEPIPVEVLLDEVEVSV